MKKFAKSLALVLACLQLTVCFGCGNSGKSNKKSSSSKSSGFDSPDEAIEAYLKAAVDEDANAIYNMFYEDEIDMWLNMLNERYDEKITKSEFKSFAIEQLEEALEECHEELSYYPIKEWKMNYEDREDITNEIDDYDNVDYNDINLKKAYIYDSVGMIHEDPDDFVEFRSDDICCLQFGDKWYIYMMNVIDV